MGLINSSIRVTMLLSQKHDLEYKIMLITQAQMNLGQNLNDLMQVGTDYSDPDSPVVKQLKQREQRLQQLEKRLDLQQKRYQARLDMVTTELESARKMRDQAIKAIFTY